MRVQALQLLAMCQLACASPCKPSYSSTSVALSTTSAELTSIPTISSSTVADTTEISTTFSVESTAVSETETASSETETVTASGSTTQAASDSATSTFVITTSSSEPTTLATSTAEPTTTTTAVAEPTNVLTNPGFESGSAAPWSTISQRGGLYVFDQGSHSGQFYGYFIADYDEPVVLGVDHPVDKTLLEADTEYHYSIWIKTQQAADCNTRWITCGAGGGFISSSDWAGPYSQWTQFTMSCMWSQSMLDLGPSIQIRAECRGLEFYVDDAVLIKAD
ncbi:hypothetical protein FPANT_2138 [Fusarium pseudoanthophilum]|uniref:CBM-cenC domain-containing protein n=1 Tax=Fusarium pseudoanthophilum TaxID=48495 RepID=A0A8H5UVD6_9HYPO|nr:hypothetical protein FPANT_2138 [Fusarium pseudoanthophilum]